MGKNGRKLRNLLGQEIHRKLDHMHKNTFLNSKNNQNVNEKYKLQTLNFHNLKFRAKISHSHKNSILTVLIS